MIIIICVYIYIYYYLGSIISTICEAYYYSNVLLIQFLVLFLISSEIFSLTILSPFPNPLVHFSLLMFSLVEIFVCFALLGQAAVIIAVSFTAITSLLALFLLVLFEWLPSLVLMLAMLEFVRHGLTALAQRTM